MKYRFSPFECVLIAFAPALWATIAIIAVQSFTGGI